ncbi:hypothetical protein [Pandoraea commovens]|uniref:Uncharacterized protein n=1 Tax=Pandoraea commovens TaxID=2508289 RepID=A0ABY5QJ21_9BURK|nr:hypothetical protein [Pandoraea commovens]UVA80450.1 hypothetical protein NTU39_05345 [Pandoraea commovens]
MELHQYSAAYLPAGTAHLNAKPLTDVVQAANALDARTQICAKYPAATVVDIFRVEG